ncbi:MAG: hypothetical protein KC713_06055 [Candidatus Omnitrophica bacterium]|nr:hypothetical protein [Candidatus Omnitrophota bacterium]
MDFEKYWNKALKQTEIIRSRIQSLGTVQDTYVPYIFLAESSINQGDTVVRKGEVIVKRPALYLPPNNPQFEGFEFGADSAFHDAHLVNFLIVRGISLPSLQYDNKTHSLDVYEGRLSKAIDHYSRQLQEQENILTGLISGPEEAWQFSVLIFICNQILKNSQNDIAKLLEEFKKDNDQNSK